MFYIVNMKKEKSSEVFFSRRFSILLQCVPNMARVGGGRVY